MKPGEAVQWQEVKQWKGPTNATTLPHCCSRPNFVIVNDEAIKCYACGQLTWLRRWIPSGAKSSWRRGIWA